MSTFPIILERACRDRAVTQHQMQTFRQAWAGVTSILVIDPIVLPTTNNLKSIPFELLCDAFPNMSWNQPMNYRRAMYMTSKYMTPNFAVELSARMGCPPEKGCLTTAGIPRRSPEAASSLL